MNRKSKRQGWTYPEVTIKGKKADIIAECLDPQPYWDDWNDHRDGMRGYNDNTRIKPRELWCAEYFDADRWNKKLKKLRMRRKKRQGHIRNETKRNKRI